MSTNFYPRPHMEGDIELYLEQKAGVIFLPTPSHGGRPIARIPARQSVLYFYPRPHMEGDQLDILAQSLLR